MELLQNKLSMENVTETQVDKALDGFFNVLNPQPVEPIIIETPSVGKLPVNKPGVQVKEVSLGMNAVEAPKPTSESRPRQLPKLGSTPSLHVPIGEVLQSKVEYAEDRAIKYIDGEPHYRCSYTCESCEHKGTRYVRPTYDFTRCHDCGEKLTVESAVPFGELEKDSDGNYFIAREKFEENYER